MNFSITVLPGDGIGPEVISEAVKVMNAVGNRFGHTFNTTYGRVGGNAIDDFGTPSAGRDGGDVPRHRRHSVRSSRRSQMG